MKKYLSIFLAIVMLSFALPVKSENLNQKNVKSKAVKTAILRFAGSDHSGDYTVYVYAEPDYQGSICCGHATINVVDNNTSIAYGYSGLVGVMTEDNVSGKAILVVDGHNVKIFFDL